MWAAGVLVALYLTVGFAIELEGVLGRAQGW
jgi:hypothetical protein